MFADAVWPDGWPREGDAPAGDLYLGSANPTYTTAAGYMGRYCIARHGSAGLKIHAVNALKHLPIAAIVDVGFCDAHVEPVKDEDLWKLYWHNGWDLTTTYKFK